MATCDKVGVHLTEHAYFEAGLNLLSQYESDCNGVDGPSCELSCDGADGPCSASAACDAARSPPVQLYRIGKNVDSDTLPGPVPRPRDFLDSPG